MKKNILSALILLIVSFATSNTVMAENYETYEPKVDKAYEAKSGKITVSSVIVTDNATIVFIDFTTSRSNRDAGTIGFSAKTTMKARGTKVETTATEWGVVDRWGDLSARDFDVNYRIAGGQTYTFYIAFEKVPEGCDKIDVVENVKDGFFWKGIKINNAKKSSSKDKDTKKKEEPKETVITPDKLQSI